MEQQVEKQRKSMKTKTGFFWKIKKIDRPLTRYIMKKRKKILIITTGIKYAVI